MAVDRFDSSVDAELARRVDAALKQLPAPAAPATLAARVMGAIRDEAPARAGVEWPVAWKIALTAMAALLVAGALLAWPYALEFARTGWQSPAVVLLRATAAAARPLVPVALLYIAAMVAACAAAASMLKHVALGGASNS
ncbi:MAG: hypothetical protein EPO35_01225 [Acidobacteria bacterium]|nr:MAG: hypothetical protein EPO35_01225 [Acidobacteriota bacterium]